MRISQRAVLAALNGKLKQPEHLGWIFPATVSGLIPTLRNVVKAGKRIIAVPAINGMINFYAQEPGDANIHVQMPSVLGIGGRAANSGRPGNPPTELLSSDSPRPDDLPVEPFLRLRPEPSGSKEV